MELFPNVLPDSSPIIPKREPLLQSNYISLHWVTLKRVLEQRSNQSLIPHPLIQDRDGREVEEGGPLFNLGPKYECCLLGSTQKETKSRYTNLEMYGRP